MNRAKLVITSTIFLFVCTTAHSAPTVEETKTFLTDVADGCGQFPVTVSDAVTNDTYSVVTSIKYPDKAKVKISMNGTVVSFVQRSNKQIVEADVDIKYLMNIADIDPTITLEEQSLKLSCSTGNCIHTYYERTFSIGGGRKLNPPKKVLLQDEKTNEAAFYICNIKDAARIQKALIHLVKESGGTESPF